MNRRPCPTSFVAASFALFAILLSTSVSAREVSKGPWYDNRTVQDAGSTARQTATSPAQDLRPAHVDVLALPPADMPVKSAVTDSVHGYAYFASDAGIVKLRLSDFVRVGSLPLPDEVGDARAAAIDPNAGFAYFLASAPRYQVRLFRVRLSDFTYAGSVDLGEQSNYPLTVAVDPVRGYLYATTIYTPAVRSLIVRVRLSDLSIQSTLSVSAGEIDLAMIDPAAGYAYFCSGDSITKVDLSTFVPVATLQMHPDGWYATGGMMDASGGYAYIIVRSYSHSDTISYIVKLRLSDFTIVGSLPSVQLATVVGPLDGFGYFVTARDGAGHACQESWSASPCELFRMRLSDLTESASISLDFGTSAATWDPATRSAYLVDPKIGVKRVQLDSMSLAGTARLYPAFGPQSTAVIDPAGGYAYFGSSNSGPGLFERIRLADFSYAGALLLEQNENNTPTALLDAGAGYAYLGVNPSGESRGRASLIRVRLANFTRDATLTDPFGYATIFGPGVIDPGGGYAYFVMSRPPFDPGGIQRIRLSDFTSAGDVPLSLTTPPSAAVIDPEGGHAYFAGSYGMERLRLSDFTIDGQLLLAPNGWTIGPGLIDPVRGVAYFGGGPGGMIRIRLSDFTRLDDLSLGCSAGAIYSAAIDPAAGFAFFVAYNGTDMPVLIRVNLDQPAQVRCYSFSRWWLPYAYRAAVIDPGAGFLYVGADSRILRVDVQRFPNGWLPILAR